MSTFDDLDKVALLLAEHLSKRPAEQAGRAAKRAKCSEESRKSLTNTNSLPLLGKFVDVFLAFGSEVVARLDSEPTLKSKYLDRLDPTVCEALLNRRRCSFSWVSDTTTLASVREGAARAGANTLL